MIDWHLTETFSLQHSNKFSVLTLKTRLQSQNLFSAKLSNPEKHRSFSASQRPLRRWKMVISSWLMAIATVESWSSTSTVKKFWRWEGKTEKIDQKRQSKLLSVGQKLVLWFRDSSSRAAKRFCCSTCFDSRTWQAAGLRGWQRKRKSPMVSCRRDNSIEVSKFPFTVSRRSTASLTRNITHRSLATACSGNKLYPTFYDNTFSSIFSSVSITPTEACSLWTAKITVIPSRFEDTHLTWRQAMWHRSSVNLLIHMTWRWLRMGKKWVCVGKLKKP